MTDAPEDRSEDPLTEYFEQQLEDDDEPERDVPELDDEELAELGLSDQIKYAIARGEHRIKEISEYTTYSESQTRRKANEMHEADNELDRSRDGRGYRYDLLPAAIGTVEDRRAAMESTMDSSPAVDHGETDPGADHGGKMPANRDYDWSEFVPDATRWNDYQQVNTEWDESVSLIENRHDCDLLPHIVLSGPTGQAKTLFAYNMASKMSAPLFTVQCSDGMLMKDVIGGPVLVGNQTWWVDGTVTKALLASRERPVVLLLDEVNRATSRAKSTLMEVLDDRAQVTLDARGGEVIEGDPMNLIVISTMNRGPGYITNRIDNAERRRLGREYRVNWLGIEDKEAEMDLVVEQTPVGYTAAKHLVETANEFRQKAEESGSALDFGLTTALVIDWAKTAWALKDVDEPIEKAAQRVFIDPYYSGNDDVQNVAEQIIERNVGGFPIEEEAIREKTGEVVEEPDDEEGEQYVECSECGWYEATKLAEDKTLAMMMCPECGSNLTTMEM